MWSWANLPEQSLKSNLSQYPHLLLAFSGGADSSLLLAACARFKLPTLAVQCVGSMCPPWEQEQARDLAGKLGIELLQVDAGELNQPAIKANGELRCYHCKHHKMSLLLNIAQQRNFTVVADGSQLDDLNADRPGNRALRELGIISPLVEAGLNKAQTRELAARWGLPLLPASACLATRIEQNTALDEQALLRIGRAENILRNYFGGTMRLRDFYPSARLEVENHELAKARQLEREIMAHLRLAGYNELTIAAY